MGPKPFMSSGGLLGPTYPRVGLTPNTFKGYLESVLFVKAIFCLFIQIWDTRYSWEENIILVCKLSVYGANMFRSVFTPPLPHCNFRHLFCRPKVWTSWKLPISRKYSAMLRRTRLSFEISRYESLSIFFGVMIL